MQFCYEKTLTSHQFQSTLFEHQHCYCEYFPPEDEIVLQLLCNQIKSIEPTSWNVGTWIKQMPDGVTQTLFE